MAEENKNLEETTEVVKTKVKSEVKKDNWLVRLCKKFTKLCKDTVGELKKVSWLSKVELKKSTKLVIVTVVAFAVVILAVDSVSSYLINLVAGLLG